MLLVEDDPGDQELTKRVFDPVSDHIDLRVVSTGQEAIDYLMHRGDFKEPVDAPLPDLVLLDLNLPVLDGREVLKMIRTTESLKRLVVIVMTTSDQEKDILSSYELNCNSYITKPIDVEEFANIGKSLQLYWFHTVTLPPAQVGQSR